MTGPDTLDQLALRFAELESAQYGDTGHTRILDRVGGIERQLGIGDLADFTPPQINPPYD